MDLKITGGDATADLGSVFEQEGRDRGFDFHVFRLSFQSANVGFENAEKFFGFKGVCDVLHTMRFILYVKF